MFTMTIWLCEDLFIEFLKFPLFFELWLNHTNCHLSIKIKTNHKNIASKFSNDYFLGGSFKILPSKPFTKPDSRCKLRKLWVYLSKCSSIFSSPEDSMNAFLELSHLETHSKSLNSSCITRSLLLMREISNSGSNLGKSIVFDTISKLLFIKLEHKLATWVWPDARVNWNQDTT